MPFRKQCGPCRGSGYHGMNSRDTCIICKGFGEVEMPGESTDYRICKPCAGSGFYGMNSQDICKLCGGLGITAASVPTVRVGIPNLPDTDEFVGADNRILLELPNRGALLEQLPKLVAKNAPVAVLFVDLDNFKPVNDKLGHAAGDKCLEKVTHILGTVVSGKGKVYRYGGDEFVITMPNASAVEALGTGERIRREIEVGNVGVTIAVTVSIGVSATDIHPFDSANGLVEAADQAMYVSKNSGRNRVTCAVKS